MVEFFVPFDLDEICSRSSAKYKITENQLSDFGNSKLPWFSKTALAKAGGDNTCKYIYNLYLLPFDKNEATQISQKIFPIDQDIVKRIEFEEKFDDEGESCFARLAIDSQGHPDFDKMSLSTLPWALGRLAQQNFAALNHKNYEIEQEKLKSELDSLASHLENPKSEVIVDSINTGVLSAIGLKILLTTLKRWAGFSPSHPIAVVFDIIEIKPKKSKLRLTNQSLTPLIHENNAHEKNITEEIITKEIKYSGARKNPTPEATFTHFDILNSFYIEDLEKVINDIANRPQESQSLLAYINGTNQKEKIDLYLKENNAYITHKLKPQFLNHGRWPTNDAKLMTLMQQFAINESLYPTQNTQLFSVNGPPGTGKTTMLQDIVAENIVRRARVLSEFKSSVSAFSGKLTINFSNKESTNIDILNERLTGFEMIVASSNNAAVENISKELPLKRKIPEKYQAACNYLTPVASKIAAEHKKQQVTPLLAEDKPWGLISVALGNSKNRNQFREHAFFEPEDKENATSRIKAQQYLTIWEWKNQYKGATFLQAKRLFIKADKELQLYLDKIKRFSDLQELLTNNDIHLYFKHRYTQLETYELSLDNLTEQREHIYRIREKLKHDKNQIHYDYQQYQQLKPNWLQRLLGTKIAKNYKAQLNAMRNDCDSLISQQRQLSAKANEIHSELITIKNEIQTISKDLVIKKQDYQKLQYEYAKLSNELNDIVLPPKDSHIEDDAIQLQAFWQNEKLNDLRTNLFICALNLHEAWLAEVLRNGYFSKNIIAISKLLGNKRPLNAAHEQAIWQSFFMWIPVVSSTFASIARQFRNVGPKQLGWLLIDEAGQAIPQAAVGAIWRAKQTIVVGDPLQIEPVITIPPNLIEGLARYQLKNNYQKWLPTFASIQSLADDANLFGVYAEEASNNQWVGSPLRVHRRCLDPMFSVANSIAYNNKMLNARTDPIIMDSHYLLGESAWFDVSGEVNDKHYVPAQGKLFLDLFIKLYQEKQELPKTLYVITPFRRIKQNLQKLILDIDLWSTYLPEFTQLPRKSALKKWCAKHIGTVHTFQGKEADIVIFILGADQKSQGAVNWASSKPNLLNVALTRAKDRIYVIGDYELWSTKKYFSELANVLPKRDAFVLP